MITEFQIKAPPGCSAYVSQNAPTRTGGAFLYLAGCPRPASPKWRGEKEAQPGMRPAISFFASTAAHERSALLADHPFLRLHPSRVLLRKGRERRSVSHGNPQTQVVITVVWIVVVAGSGAGVAAMIIEGAAPHGAATGSTFIFAAIFHIVQIISVQAVCPLPDITSHIGRAVGAVARRGIGIHRSRAARPAFDGYFIRRENASMRLSFNCRFDKLSVRSGLYASAL